ncbi:permease prefix domain 1-containing protein [Anaerovorax odorimutans]|uniref:permease prefix domain 1-containing protein n=1 Tax=Anaerovorax odorimutans TaxID=109327 RepID=UPI0004183BBB|nr:permease prefix domain 1-containing protein [Anaerovorax odorimutans]
MWEPNNKINEYINMVLHQIRWKKAHDNISQELLNHIDDQKNTFINKGQDEKTAELNAVAQMGDAVIVGQQLDRIHRAKTEWSILAIIGICILISVAAQYLISLNSVKCEWTNPLYLADYLKTIPFGIGILLITYFMDYSLLAKYPKILYGSALGVCILLFGVSSRRNGSYIHVFYFALLFIVLYSLIVYSQRNKGYTGIVFCGIVGIMTNLIFLYAASILSAWMFTLCGAIILTVAVIKNWFKVSKKFTLLLVWVPIILSFLIFLYIRSDVLLRDNGYILMMVRDLLADSQFIGQGSLASLKEYNIENYLPSWYYDYSLLYFTYKFGWIVSLGVITVTAFLIIRIFNAVKKQRSELGFILSLSICLAISIQSIMFLLSNLGVWAYGLCPLPLLSPGKISFLINMALLGFLLSAYRYNNVMKDPIILQEK